MPDREKVIKGLECCMKIGICGDACPYHEDIDPDVGCDIFADALALLREKEPLPGTWLPDRPGHYRCSVCGAQWGQAARTMKHCPDCGRRMEV